MSGQTQPETALQSLAEKLRTDAIAIFGEGQAERYIIEWFYGALLAAAPATPAAQGFRDGVASVANSAIPNNQDAGAAQTEQRPATQQVLDLILDECRYWHGRDEARRGGFACLYAKAKEIADNAAATAQPAAHDHDHDNDQGEAVEVVGYRVSMPGEPELGAWLDEEAESEPQIQAHEPLMTVAQHNRILAARVPAGCKVVPVELLELLREMADLHERRGTVLTVHMEQLRALLASAEGVKDE